MEVFEMRKLIFLLAITSCLLSGQLIGEQAQPRKRRIAIMDFDYATVHSNVSAIFGSNVDIGQGIFDMLVKYGMYSIIERKALDKILAEQNFSQSDRANPASAAKFGKLLGVDAIIV